ncbi:hypothetical protein LTR37_007636 [Vermiconidia calcicola]|uniref:Uncharacterized protein n=1 Tax=Vermiconidia calcicola TaxID=1690605 RepID=A0ACC3NE17_9PEZI|nr:hypothetical protein LTR37_007636 [Vermiconidia calcicola]
MPQRHKKNATATGLLLVNHQFGAEYKQELHSMRILLFRDIGLLDPSLEEITSSSIAKASGATKIGMQLLSCGPTQDGCEKSGADAFDDVRQHCVSVTKLLNQLAQIQQIEMQVFVYSSAPASLQWSQHAELVHMMGSLDHLIKLSKVTGIEVYAFSWPDEDEVEVEDEDGFVFNRRGEDAYKQDRKLVTKWTKREGWQAQC